jgi:hypothetical protein
MLIFQEAAWLNGRTTIYEAETNKGIWVQIHESSDIPWVYWFEATNKEEVIYSSITDEAAFSNYVSVEDAANQWFVNFQ